MLWSCHAYELLLSIVSDLSGHYDCRYCPGEGEGPITPKVLDGVSGNSVWLAGFGAGVRLSGCQAVCPPSPGVVCRLSRAATRHAHEASQAGILACRRLRFMQCPVCQRALHRFVQHAWFPLRLVTASHGPKSCMQLEGWIMDHCVTHSDPQCNAPNTFIPHSKKIGSQKSLDFAERGTTPFPSDHFVASSLCDSGTQ